MLISEESANEVFKRLCHDLMHYASPVTARGLRTLELTNMRCVMTNPRKRLVPSRKPDMRYMVGELCWYLDGRTDLRSIAHYSKFWERVSDDGKTVNSAYGFRLFKVRNMLGSDRPGVGETAFMYAMRCLEQDEYSRKAVMPIYFPEDGQDSKDNPCTMSLQLFIRFDKLHLHVLMRSQDVWLGFPYDVPFFALVQEIALIHLRKKYPTLELGTYTHDVTSLHVYENHFDDVDGVCGNPKARDMMMPVLVSEDVASWFNDLLTYEKSLRGLVQYKEESKRTEFQDWCKKLLS